MNTVLLKYLGYSGELFKSYSVCPQVYLQNISASSFKAEQLTGRYSENFKNSAIVFQSLNDSTVTSYKYFTSNVNGILNNTSLVFQAYCSSLSDVNSYITKLSGAAGDASVISRSLKPYPESYYFKEAGEIIFSFKEYIDKYSYLITSAETNFSTLQNLQTDELKHEVSLVTGQLTENLKNYGVSVNSSLLNVIDEFNISLKQFVNRSNEYTGSLNNSLAASSVRNLYKIDKNSVIIPAKIEKIEDSVIAQAAYKNKADYFLAQNRNDYKLFPADYKNEFFGLLFSTEGNENTGKLSVIEPAKFRKLNDGMFELIKKGILHFK